MELKNLLNVSAKKGASDLHLSAGMPPVVRIDGQIEHLDMAALDAKKMHRLLYELMNDTQRKEYEAHMETDFAISLPGLARFRANVFNQLNGPAAVFRTIPEKILSLDQIGAPDIFSALAMQHNGLILVTGATGSGKSTTLAAMLDHINAHKKCHILTIEDPIEFVHCSRHALINQRELNQHTLSFSNALRSALREDPDVILIGEMRDIETIRLALTAAETGHLVLGTLHTRSAAKTIDRIIDVFPANEKDMIRAMLAESLKAVLAQCLLPKINGGRVPAWEILLATPAIRNLIRENKIPQMESVLQTNQEKGMTTLDQSLITLFKSEVISLETISHYIRDKNKIEEMKRY